MVDDISLATLGPSRKINFSQFFRFHVFIFGVRHVSELPACEITNFAKQHFAARIVFVTNGLPVRVLDKPITPICVIFRCASLRSENIFGFGTIGKCHKCEMYHFEMLYLAGGIF